jgi:hypothetical protein
MCELAESTLMRNVREIYCEVDEDRFDGQDLRPRSERWDSPLRTRTLKASTAPDTTMFERKVPSSTN